MAQKSEDRRVLRTHKLLQQALIELNGEKGFANVSLVSLLRHMQMDADFHRFMLSKGVVETAQHGQHQRFL